MDGRRDWLAVLALVGVCAAAVLSGTLEVLFVPFYVGTTLLPVVVLLGIVGNVVLPRLGHALVDTSAGAVLPFLAWLVPVLGLALTPRSEGDVLVVGGGAQQWTYYALLLLGCIAGFAAVLSVTGPRVTR